MERSESALAIFSRCLLLWPDGRRSEAAAALAAEEDSMDSRLDSKTSSLPLPPPRL